MKYCARLFIVVVLLFTIIPAYAARERISLNADWRFQKNDPADTGDVLNYYKIKDYLLPTGNAFAAAGKTLIRPDGNPGENVAYTRSDFDDSAWRTLNLPHDWGIEGPFDQNLPGETAKLPWAGVGWYRKHFKIEKDTAGQRQTYLQIDGAMSYSAVWCNGQLVGGWPYGYSSYQLDLTPYLKPGEENVLAIRLENPQESSRWYPGGGIYRNVWLLRTEAVHLAHWSTQLTTEKISASSATVNISTKLENPANLKASLNAEIFAADAAGKMTGPVLATARFAPNELQSSALLKNPRLWDTAHPHLYVAVITVTVDGKKVDQTETTFGVREFRFTADNGFLLNGKRVPIQGVCMHHDMGALGTAVHTRALQRQIEILQEMGVNAIRTSHNPPAPELLDLCDRMGILVMDEFVDAWKRGKKNNGYQNLFDDWSEKDIRAMVRRDRNHPSVILWSLGNEINEQSESEGPAMQKVLADFVRQEDTTRPTIMGVSDNKAGYNGFQKGLDVFGFNYKPWDYSHFRKDNPTIPLLGSETSSTISSRGEYFFPVSADRNEGKSDFQMSSYDLFAPPWATLVDAEFKGQDENPFVAGEFVWTGFDYLGEPTPYNSDVTNLLNYHTPEAKAAAEKELKDLGKIRVPSRSSYFGIVDLAGFKKDRFYLYQARWRPDLPMVHLLPHWNWAGREGEVTPIHVYTSGDEAELFLNGKSLGRKKKAPLEYRIRWDEVKYQPGELKVVAYKAGKKWAGETVKTTGPVTRLDVKADRATILANGQDLSYVTVTLADKSGLLVPQSKNLLKFSVTGPVEIVATDNGDATSQVSFQSKELAAYNGLCLAIIRSVAGKTGPATLRVESAGLPPVEIPLQCSGP